MTDRPDAVVVELVVDGNDRIVALGAGWEDAAEAGNAPALAPARVVGRSLYDYVCGDDTTMFVRVMLAGARHRKAPTVRPYRCDTPTHKRWMEMEMQPRENGEVRIVHRLLRLQELPQRVAPLLGHGDKLPKRCSNCNKVRLEGSWHEPDAPAVVRHMIRHGEDFGVIYGICPDCRPPVGVPSGA